MCAGSLRNRVLRERWVVDEKVNVVRRSMLLLAIPTEGLKRDIVSKCVDRSQTPSNYICKERRSVCVREINVEKEIKKRKCEKGQGFKYPRMPKGEM